MLTSEAEKTQSGLVTATRVTPLGFATSALKIAPLDVPATFSTMDTVKAIAREFADSARKRLEALTGNI